MPPIWPMLLEDDAGAVPPVFWALTVPNARQRPTAAVETRILGRNVMMILRAGERPEPMSDRLQRCNSLSVRPGMCRKSHVTPGPAPCPLYWAAPAAATVMNYRHA